MIFILDASNRLGTDKELTNEEIMQYISINKKIEEISNNLKG